MALMTGEQYIESIRKMNMEIYMFGEKVKNPVDNPILRPSLNSVRMTYDLAQDPEYQDLMVVTSPFTGEKINRFTHIHQSTEDLKNKVKMQRLCGQKTAACFQQLCRNGCSSTQSSPQHMKSIKNMVHLTMRTSKNS